MENNYDAIKHGKYLLTSRKIVVMHIYRIIAAHEDFIAKVQDRLLQSVDIRGCIVLFARFNLVLTKAITKVQDR